MARDLNVDMQQLLKQLKDLGASTREINAVERAFKGTRKGTEEFAAAVDLAETKIQALKTGAEAVSSTFQDLNKIIKENNDALDGNFNVISQTAKLQRRVVSISDDLLLDAEGITDLNTRQLESKLEQLKANQKLLALSSQQALRELKDLLEKEKRVGKLTEKEQERKDNLKEIVKFNAFEDAGLNGLIAKTQKRLDLETAINKNMGVAGALVGGTGALMERLGMRSGIFHQAMKDANAEMRELAKQAGDTVNFFTKLEIAAKGFQVLADGFGPALRDPTVIAGKLFDSFLEVNKAQTEFVRRTGQAARTMGGVNTEVATLTDMMDTAVDLSKELGLNAATVFTPTQIGDIADATALLGLSAEHAAGLAKMMTLTGESQKEIEKNISSQVSLGIDQLGVLEDVSSASDDITASLGGSSVELSKASNAAKKLGMDLSKINDIADGLLEFETSIENELEAQLLTGKQLNLSKARELALNNDLAGVAEELRKNGASAAEFAEMNRIEQEGLAKALGMSREELAKSVLTEEARANMTAEQIAAARGVTLEQSRQMDIQERITKSVNRLAEAFSPVLEAVVPIVEAVLGFIRPIAAGIGYLLKFKAVSVALTTTFSVLAGYMAVKRIAEFVGVGVKGFLAMKNSMQGMNFSLKSFGDGIKGVGTAIKNSFIKGLGGNKVKAIFDENAKRFRDTATGRFISADKAKELGAKMPKAKDIASTAKGAKATKAVPPGKNIKTFLQNFSAGLRSMAGMKVLQGALNLIPASLGLVAMIPGVVGAKLMEMISGPKLLVSLQSLAGGLKAMGNAKVLLGTAALAAAALGFTLMIPGSAGMALLGLTGPMAAAGIMALIPALTALGSAMVSGVGALGLAALIATAVGLGAAFALVGAGAMMFGQGIKLAAEGFSLIFSQLGGLVQLLPSLYLMAPALYAIAGGLSAMAVSGMLALPALAGLGTLAVVAAPLMAIQGMFGEGNGETDGFAKLESKLDTLITVISEGGDVYLDSDKVGRTQAKSFSLLS